MDMMKLLSEKHHQWIRMANSLGAYHYAEDVVQEMYIKMYNCSTPIEKIAPDGVVNPWYIYRAIMSIIVDINRVKNRVTKLSLTDVWEHIITSTEDEYDVRIDEAIEAAENEMKQWHWYDRKLLEVYLQEDVSILHISRKTGISKNSLYNTLENGKNKLKAAVKHIS